MARFQRLIFIAIIALVAWLPCSSFAYPATTTTAHYDAVSVNSGYTGSTALAACQSYASASATLNGATYVIDSSSNTSCNWHMMKSGSAYGSGMTTSIYFTAASTSCTGGGTLSGSVCTCTAPATDTGTACTVDPQADCKALNASGIPLVTNSTTPGLNGCYGGYVVRATGGAFGVKNGVASPGELYGPFTCTTTPCSMSTTGGSSTSTTAPPPAATDTGATAAQCKSTEYWGTVNGIGTCVKGVGTSFGGENKTAPTPAGSASAPTSGLGSDAPPSATGLQKETTCSGGSCTTTTTYTKGDGSTVGTKTETKDQKSFCQDNPAASVCIQSSLSAGACGTPDVCTGDAIQCAINAQSKATTCALTTAPTGDTNIAAFNTAAGQSQGDQTAGITTTVNISESNFDQTDVLGASAGLQDQVVSIAGQSVTIPWSQMNTLLTRIGLVMQACTFLLCARIVMRG